MEGIRHKLTRNTLAASCSRTFVSTGGEESLNPPSSARHIEMLHVGPYRNPWELVWKLFGHSSSSICKTMQQNHTDRFPALHVHKIAASFLPDGSVQLLFFRFSCCLPASELMKKLKKHKADSNQTSPGSDASCLRQTHGMRRACWTKTLAALLKTKHFVYMHIVLDFRQNPCKCGARGLQQASKISFQTWMWIWYGKDHCI